MADIDQKALALALQDIAGWLENEGGHKHARTVRLAITALRSVSELEVENKRLREALTGILSKVEGNVGRSTWGYVQALCSIAQIARAALKRQEPAPE